MSSTLFETRGIRPAFINNPMKTSTEWVERGNEVNKDFEDYKTTLAKTMELNIKLVDELPTFKTISKEEIKEYFKKLLEIELSKDQVLEKSVEIRKYSRDLKKHLQAYFREIFDFHNKMRDDITRNIMDAGKVYFNSDLPISFLKTSEAGSLVLKDYLDVYDKKIKQERIQLVAVSSNDRKFKILCEAHNAWIKPLVERLDKLDKVRVKLAWYVDLSNCVSIEDFDKSKAIKLSNIDIRALNDFTDEINTLISQLDAMIKPDIEFKPLLSYDDSNAMVIRNIMELLQA